MNISEDMKNEIKERLDYNDEDLEIFLKNPNNLEILSKSIPLLNKTIIIEVLESHGCNTQHKVGDKFYFDGTGNLLTKLSPKKICIYALSVLNTLIHSALELIYAGVDPNEMRFKRASCFDIGLRCGGWGNIVMELKVIDRNKIN
ncbi:MAG: TIGR04076 family protein [Candidatus Lokiarchaeota archaeon]|nr:TIGR04076 family protein [Candidatus Lokiarchaeota archaeon]